MTLRDLPTLNACLNSLATLLLIAGWVAIRKGRRDLHRNIMVAALATSAVFLCSYLYYHFHVPTTKYQGQGVMRNVYFFILATHVVLAMVVPPASLVAVWHAARGRFDRHVRVTRWLWPVWLYVSVTGVVVYLMLYVF